MFIQLTAGYEGEIKLCINTATIARFYSVDDGTVIVCNYTDGDDELYLVTVNESFQYIYENIAK